MTSLVITPRVYSETESYVQRAKQDSKIKNLSIREIHIDEPTAKAVVELLQDRQWERINLQYPTGQIATVVSAIGMGLDKIQRLVFVSDDRLNDDLWVRLAYSQSLCYLRLKTNLFRENVVALSRGLAYNMSLQHLHLQGSAFADEAIDTFSHALKMNQMLKILELEGCNLKCHQVTKIVKALESHPKIEHLNLTKNEASESSISAISSMILSECNELRKLVLGQQTFRSDEMIDMAAIEFEGSTLTELNLSSNNFQDGDIANISARLESDHSIQKLFLNDNGITDQGIRLLASAIPEMKGLKEIWLYDNHFSSEAAESLIDATRVNYDLERVYIAKSSHHSLMEVQKHVDYNLCLNKGGRRLLKAQNICPSLWPLVFERAIKMLRWGAYVNGKRAQADVIFYLLHGPALLERNDENF